MYQLKQKAEVDTVKLHLQRIGMEDQGLSTKSQSMLNPFAEKQPKDFIRQLQTENQIEAQNHASGLHGLSFCPFHRTCPSYATRRRSFSFGRLNDKVFQPQPLRATSPFSDKRLLQKVNEQTSR